MNELVKVIATSLVDKPEEVVVTDAYEGKRGSVILKSHFPIENAFYEFYYKDVSYEYRDK